MVLVDASEESGNNFHLSVCCSLKVLEAESVPG